ncbi:MAG: flagellar hook-associated protein FlgK [Anaerolineae bacterium]|nr:flagellar hook-associated protein FlgK [Anaerolineae bacterium]MDW8099679.1 flagellar hook-associated protein FlgK [Anaerolineae bacterium]
MTSAFFGLQIGLSALQAHQRALETINHNIANVNTEGYSRQEVLLTSLSIPAGERTGQGYIRAGVQVAGIQRYASAFLTEQIRRETGEEARWQAMSNVLGQIQAIFHEPSDNGLGATLDRFWAAWKDLGTEPTSFSLRVQLRELARQVAALIQRIYQQLLQLREEISQRVRETIRQVNDLAVRIADVDRQVRQGMIAGTTPNDLLDQRDRLLIELGRMVKVTTAFRPDGGVTVSLGGHLLVSDRGAHQIDETSIPPVWIEDGSPVSVLGGQWLGLLEARDEEIPVYMDRLNHLASALITAVNTAHRSGYGLNNATGLDFFVGTDASDIQVAAAIMDDVNNIAAASAPDAPGDGGHALDIARLAGQALAPQGATLGAYYGTMIALVGLGVQHANAQARNQSVLLRYLNERRDAISGVSLDEEAVKLIASQRAYEAAARVITAMDEMLEQLIKGTGIVGR